MPETFSSTIKPKMVMLDISMFILELLDDKKIKENFQSSDLKLEVPAALVEMMRLHREGNPLLQIFVRAYLLAMRQNKKHQESKDLRIKNIVNASIDELNRITFFVANNLVKKFGTIIEGVEKETPEEYGEESTFKSRQEKNFPINKYGLLPESTESELSYLKSLYSTHLRIAEHSLITLYFLQVYYAQRHPNHYFRREVMAIGRQTHLILEHFHKGILNAPPENTIKVFQFSVGHSTSGIDAQDFSSEFQKSTLERYRNFITWFWQRYIREEWQDAVKEVMVEVTVSAVAGTAIDAPLLLATLLTLEIGKAIYRYPGLKKSEKPVIWAIATFFIFLCCIGAYRIWPLIFLPATTQTPLASPTIDPTLSVSPIPMVEITPTSTPEISNTQTAIPTSIIIPFTPTPGSGHCYYVIQPGDTRQSIAERFKISVDELVASDDLLKWGAFTTHQMIRINAPCCRPNGDIGKTHFVQRGETLYSLEKMYGVSVDRIVKANNLYDARYIQVGQMLCIP